MGGDDNAPDAAGVAGVPGALGGTPRHFDKPSMRKRAALRAVHSRRIRSRQHCPCGEEPTMRDAT